MILGNKCDMENKRMVAKRTGEAVSHTNHSLLICQFHVFFNHNMQGNIPDKYYFSSEF